MRNKTIWYTVTLTVCLVVGGFFLLPYVKDTTYEVSYAEAAGLVQAASPKRLYDIYVIGKTGKTISQIDLTKQQDFAVPFDVYLSNIKGAVLMDLNGDGLSDIISASQSTTSQTDRYVLLNNGHGFDITYYCYLDEVGDPLYSKYYGTCAE